MEHRVPQRKLYFLRSCIYSVGVYGTKSRDWRPVASVQKPEGCIEDTGGEGKRKPALLIFDYVLFLVIPAGKKEKVKSLRGQRSEVRDLRSVEIKQKSAYSMQQGAVTIQSFIHSIR